MLIGIMADSHDNVPRVRQAVAAFQQRQVGLVVHAGDFVAPFAVAPLAELRCPVLAVFGNNDGERRGLTSRFAEGIGEVHDQIAEREVAGRRLAAVHYPELGQPLADSGRYDVVVYGHNHKLEISPGSCLRLNPGETGGWLTGRSTVLVLDAENLEVEVVDLN